MKIKIDRIPKEERKEFKAGIMQALDQIGNIQFKNDEATLSIPIIYPIDDASLSLKSRLKKRAYEFISRYRLVQFNRD